jgi:hypothetical protein
MRPGDTKGCVGDPKQYNPQPQGLNPPEIKNAGYYTRLAAAAFVKVAGGEKPDKAYDSALSEITGQPNLPLDSEPVSFVLDPKGLETNGLANIIMHIEGAESGAYKPDLAYMRGQAEKMIRYLEARERGEYKFWHETK